MARLPKPGQDAGVWAQMLNDFLLVSHNSDGTLRPDSVSTLATATATTAASTGTVGLNDLKTTNPPSDPITDWVLSNDGTNLVWRRDVLINVHDYGAKGDGITDDTAAIQAAIDSAPNGGQIIFPRGVFMTRGIKLKYNGIQLTGSRWGVRITRLSGTDPLIDASGTSSLNGHIKYGGLFSITLNGNNLPGPLLRSYYSDNFVYRDVSFIHCPGVATDFVEAWDSRFYDCSWEDCGSSTDPAALFRNSTPSGTFGYSTDNTNQIHFLGCRWEGWRSCAVKLDGGANGSTSLLNGMFFVSSKMESRFAAGSPFQIMPGSTLVFSTQLYIAIMAPDTGFTTPIDAITDYGTQVFMTDTYVQWGSSPGLANSALHVWAGGPHAYHKFSSFFPSEDPATGVVIAEPNTDVAISRPWSNRGTRFVGDITSTIEGSPDDGYRFLLDNIGTLRVVSSITNNDIVKIDNNSTRPAFELVNGLDAVGFSDNYATEKWRIIGATGAARLAGGKFQVEATKGYIAINTTPFTNIAMLIKAAVEGDRGLAIVRPTSTATNRLLEFQDETYNIQGMSIDSNGRPVAVGTPPRVTPGDQVTYANPKIQVRDIAGGITAAVRPSPTAPGIIALVTFSRAYNSTPISIILTDHSNVNANLYVSARSATGFTVSTRNALPGGSILNFDYVVIA